MWGITWEGNEIEDRTDHQISKKLPQRQLFDIIKHMTYQDTIQISTKGFCDIHNITEQISSGIELSGIKDGLVCVSVVGSTLGVTTIEYEPNLVEDFKDFWERLIPQDLETRHGATWGDDNGFSHLRASLLGPSITVPVKEGSLLLGTWQQIIVVDFDNRPRERDIIVTVTG